MGDMSEMKNTICRSRILCCRYTFYLLCSMRRAIVDARRANRHFLNPFDLLSVRGRGIPFSIIWPLCENVVVVVFTLKAVPVSTQYFLTSVLVQLTRTPSVVTG